MDMNTLITCYIAVLAVILGHRLARWCQYGRAAESAYPAPFSSRVSSWVSPFLWPLGSVAVLYDGWRWIAAHRSPKPVKSVPQADTKPTPPRTFEQSLDDLYGPGYAAMLQNRPQKQDCGAILGGLGSLGQSYGGGYGQALNGFGLSGLSQTYNNDYLNGLMGQRYAQQQLQSNQLNWYVTTNTTSM